MKRRIGGLALALLASTASADFTGMMNPFAMAMPMSMMAAPMGMGMMNPMGMMGGPMGMMNPMGMMGGPMGMMMPMMGMGMMYPAMRMAPNMMSFTRTNSMGNPYLGGPFVGNPYMRPQPTPANAPWPPFFAVERVQAPDRPAAATDRAGK